MAVTHTLIETVTVGVSGAASIEFSSIPQTYTDLQIVASVRSDDPSTNGSFIKFNNNTSNYSSRWVYGNGGSAASATFSTTQGVDINAATQTASTFASFSVYIPNYAGSTNKSYSTDGVTETNGTTAFQELIAGLWSNTSAINQVTFYLSGSNKFVQHSLVSLYGIKNS